MRLLDCLQLCQSCQNLELSIDKFVISSNTATGPDSSPAAASETSPKFRLTSGNASRVLARVGKVQERRNICRLCDLTCMAIDRYSGRGAVETTADIYLTWEVDGRQRAADSDRLINRTRRIRLTWKAKDGKEETVYLVFVAPTGARRLNSDAYASKATKTHFLGRGLFDTREKQALMKSWIDLCVEKHGSACQNKHGKSSEFRQLVESTFFGVIDVIDMQLKPLPIVNGQPERYVALSYVWGGGHPSTSQKPYTTTRTNVMVHIQHGGLEKAWDKLPRTLQDTILLVSRLGERYLWIDSLCIVQDSNSSWELNAKSMHLVYGNAHFTICAADGNAETGLRAVDTVLRTFEHGDNRNSRTTAPRPVSTPSNTPPVAQTGRPRQRASSPFPNGGSASNIAGSSHSTTSVGSHPPKPATTATTSTAGPTRTSISAQEVRQHRRATDEANLPPLTAECLPGIRLLVSRPTEAVIQDSPWNQRGWTFQERLLSRRCLIFAEGHVYFQCRSAVISQHIFTDGGGTNGWSLDWTNSPLRTLGELRRRAFWFYMKCIQLYTGRELTKPKDVLTAFQGASWLLEERMKAPLLYGLPSSHFDLALLWMPLSRLERRRQRTLRHSSDATAGGSPSCTQDDMGNCACRIESDGFGGKDFPSWSWSGWMGGKAEYQLSMVDGCLQNVQEWLRDHTWILWYVRDYEGNLRPLWDKRLLFQDASEEARWRGYAGKVKSGPTFANERGSRRRTVSITATAGRRNDGRDRDRHEHHVRPRPDMYYERRPPQQDSPPPGEPLRPYLAPPQRTQARHYMQTFPPERRRQSERPGPSASEGWHRSSNAAYLQRLPTGYYDDAPNNDDYIDEHEIGDRSGAGIRIPGGRQTQRSSGSDVREILDASISDKPTRVASVIREYVQDSVSHTHNGRYNLPVPSRSHRQRSPPPRRSSHGRRDGPDLSDSESTVTGTSTTTTSSTGSDDDDDGDDSRETDSRSDGRLEATHDIFGRPVRPTLAALNGTEFTGILPDNPFGVIRGPFAADNKRREDMNERDKWKSGGGGGGVRTAMPILQFWTWRTELLVTIRRETQDTWATQLGPGLCRCSVVDRAGDWCGAVVLPLKWIAAGREGAPLMFIALSDAKSLTADECPVWNYYIPKEKDESEWDLYFVMIVNRNRERALWERVAVGKVFQAAFGDAVWDEIKLG